MVKGTITFLDGRRRIPEDVIREDVLTDLPERVDQVTLINLKDIRTPPSTTEIRVVIWED